MFGKRSIEAKLTQKMQEAFSSMEDRKAAIHLTAASGAAIVAALPIGIDAWALRLAESIMVICIAGSYGEKLTKSAAKGLMLSSFAQLAGEAVAITALEAAEASKLAAAATGVGPVVAYGIKSSVAVGLIETVGHLVISYYEKPQGLGAKACKTTETIGLVADISRIATVVTDLSHAEDTANTDPDVSNFPSENKNNSISFLGSVYTESDLADAAKKVENARGKVKQYEEYLDADIKFGRDTTRNALNLRFAQEALEEAIRIYDRIKAALR